MTLDDAMRGYKMTYFTLTSPFTLKKTRASGQRVGIVYLKFPVSNCLPPVSCFKLFTSRFLFQIVYLLFPVSNCSPPVSCFKLVSENYPLLKENITLLHWSLPFLINEQGHKDFKLKQAVYHYTCTYRCIPNTVSVRQ